MDNLEKWNMRGYQLFFFFLVIFRAVGCALEDDRKGR